MPVHFQRLDNALKRANEFIEVGKNVRALEILSDVLKSRKHRVWQAKHEEIMYKFLELCVELQKSFVAKEGLYQYKIICQQAYIKSFEEVVRKFLEMAEAKATLAREKCKSILTEDLNLDDEDLDNATRPEELLMCAVSSEGTNERNERVVLLPWVKFLWDTYRHCLELLRNNPRTERLYHDIAYQTFQFCIKYNRKPEMRKLCDNLHIHLEHLKKLQANASAGGGGHQNIISLNNPESQGMHLETRLVQLESAIQMELWQEAYKATDDIKKFGLMSLARRQPKPQLMASYYQKLSLVFWKANSLLFHAAALLKHFYLSKDLKKSLTQEDLARMASRVVIAALAVPIPPSRLDIDKIVDSEDNVIENHHRNLSSLLSLSPVPTRTSLLRDMERLGVLQYAYQPLQDLYRQLEHEFAPLNLSQRVQQAITFIDEHEQRTEFEQYLPALREVTVVRLLKQLSQVYGSLRYDRLLQLCGSFVDNIYLEQILVSAARRNDLQVRINHRTQCVTFGSELRLAGGQTAEVQNSVAADGPHLQNTPSDLVRRQLVDLYSTLVRARSLIEPQKIKQQRDESKQLIINHYTQQAEIEHKMLLERQNQIEKKREELELKGIEREKEERRELEERQQRIKEAEEERLLRENEERALQIRQKEIEELQKKMARDQIAKMKQTDAGQRILNDIGEEALYDLKPEEIKNRQWKQIEKERRESALRQKKTEKKIDHFERAKRLEEIPLLQAEYEKWKVEDKKLWVELENERIKQLEIEREQALKHKERLLRIVPDTQPFIEQVQNVRHEAFLARFSAWEQSLEEEREACLIERRQKRKEERRKTYMLEKQRAEAKRMAEEARKRREEEMAEVLRLAELQMRREREAEERREQRLREKEAEDARRLAEQQEQRFAGRGERSDRDFGDLRKPRPETEERWQTNRAPVREEKDFGSLRARPTEERDFGSIRSRPATDAAPVRPREERDFGSLRDSKVERPAPRTFGEDKDFANVRSSQRDNEARPPRDFTSENRPPRASDKDFANVRSAAREIVRPARETGEAAGPVRDFSDLRAPREIVERPLREHNEGATRDFGDSRPPRDFGDSRPPRDFGDSRPPRDFGDSRPPRDFGERRNRDFGEGRPARDLGDFRRPRDGERDFGQVRSSNRDGGDRMDRGGQSHRTTEDNWRRADDKKDARKPEIKKDADSTEWRTVQKKR